MFIVMWYLAIGKRHLGQLRWEGVGGGPDGLRMWLVLEDHPLPLGV